MNHKLFISCAILSVATATMADTLPQHVLKMPRILSKKYYRPRQAWLFNDIARETLSVDKAHEGLRQGDEIIPFTGKGVVLGVIDCGIDPRHIAFRDYETGKSRVALYVTTESSVESESGSLTYKVLRPADGEKVLYKDVDKGGNGHGTHTTGTAGGSYYGNQYYGMAPEATLVLTSIGEALYDDEILFGIKTALDYGREHDMPCVTSLSLGSTAGMHDGSSPLTEMLAEELSSQGQIVCFAAGNDGDHAAWISRDFSENPTPLASAYIRGGMGTSAKAVSSMFTSMGEDWQIGFSLVEIGPEYREVWRSDMFEVSDMDYSPIQFLSQLPELAANLEQDAFIELTKMNGFNGLCGIAVSASLPWTKGDAHYTLGVILNSPHGGRIDGYTSFTPAGFANFGIKGYTSGSPDESISDHCTSPYVISVGAFNARYSYELDGKEQLLDPGNDGEYGKAALYSSYGSKPDILPHTMASGTNVISAMAPMSSYVPISSVEETPGVSWKWGVSTGTSMSTPAMAGMIALWLQADPKLNREQVLELLQRTGDINKGGERSRFGLPSAYEGLKIILDRQSSILQPGIMPEANSNKPNKLMVKYITSSQVEAVLPFAATEGEYTLCGADGGVITKGSFQGNSFIVNLPSTPGIAVLTATSPQGTANQKIRTSR